MDRIPPKLGVVVIIIIALAFVGMRSFKIIPPGHVGVATLFGEVQVKPYAEGLNFPVNPLYGWHVYDARQKTHKETANVPSQDQLQTKLEVSVQYRIMAERAPAILQNTGTAEAAISVHLIPKLRSLLREQGKSIRRAEDFFLEETQETLQASLTAGLRD